MNTKCWLSDAVLFPKLVTSKGSLTAQRSGMLIPRPCSWRSDSKGLEGPRPQVILFTEATSGQLLVPEFPMSRALSSFSQLSGVLSLVTKWNKREGGWPRGGNGKQLSLVCRAFLVTLPLIEAEGLAHLSGIFHSPALPELAAHQPAEGDKDGAGARRHLSTAVGGQPWWCL